MTFITSENMTWNGKKFSAEYFILMPVKSSDRDIARFNKETGLLNLGYSKVDDAELFAKTDALKSFDIQS